MVTVLSAAEESVAIAFDGGGAEERCDGAALAAFSSLLPLFLVVNSVMAPPSDPFNQVNLSVNRFFHLHLP